MTFFAYVGSFTANGSTGNQAITSPGFQPKAVIFFIGGSPFSLMQTPGGDASLQYFQISNQSTGTPYPVRHTLNTAGAITTWLSTQTSTERIASLSSFDPTGFTLNWTLAASGTLAYLAVGGTDVSVAGGLLTPRTSTGTQAVTGVGFSPKLLWLNYGTNQGPAGFGAATGPTARWVMSTRAISFTMSSTNAAKCIRIDQVWNFWAPAAQPPS